MNELLIKIDEIFIEDKLIGNYDATEDEYNFMKSFIGQMCENILYEGYEIETKYNKLIFITLVEIAKRWKESDIEDYTDDPSSFWDFISKILINEDKINQKLYHAFTNVIKQLENGKIITTVSTGKKFYSTLMMHSLTPKNSIFSFFDLCYNIFKKDLDYGFTKDDEWICDLFAASLRSVIGGGYLFDKKISIGSSAYSIQIGLRSFSLHDDLKDDFVNFIKNIFYIVNKLFNRETINKNTRIEGYILQWWKSKIETEKIYFDNYYNKRVRTISKNDLVVNYIRRNELVYLIIPSFRLEDCNNILWLKIFCDNQLIKSELIGKKFGEIVAATKQIELELNLLLNDYHNINLRVEIEENQEIIFDSESKSAYSLKREFILFDGEKEILGQIIKTTNYFVYTKNIDEFESIPDEIATIGKNLYNIYPKDGENIIGLKKQVSFVDKIKIDNLGKEVCLIGNMHDIEWHFDDLPYRIFNKNLKLTIPVNINLKTLELRVDKHKCFKLNTFGYEQIENNSYIFELNNNLLLNKNEPYELSLFSYEKEKTIFNDNIILFPNFDLRFNKWAYYGNFERKVTIKYSNEYINTTWNKQDNEILIPFYDGLLIIKVPYIKWQINDKGWNNDVVKGKIWYKNYIENGDLILISTPKGKDTIKLFCSIEDKVLEIEKNCTGKFEIGRTVYNNLNKRNIKVYFVYKNENYEVCNLSTLAHFIENPLLYILGKVIWNVENTFIGDNNSIFILYIKSKNNNFQTKLNCKNNEIKNLKDDFCKIQIKIQDQNLFTQTGSYKIIYEDDVLIGSYDELRFKDKTIKLISANCINSKATEWILFKPKYFITNLKYLEIKDKKYYIGYLGVLDNYGNTIMLNCMKNEKGHYDKINPIRVEFKDNKSLWLAAGWEAGQVNIGNLFCDKKLKGICNIQKQDNRYDEINVYNFKVVTHV